MQLFFREIEERVLSSYLMDFSSNWQKYFKNQLFRNPLFFRQFDEILQFVQKVTCLQRFCTCKYLIHGKNLNCKEIFRISFLHVCYIFMHVFSKKFISWKSGKTLQTITHFDLMWKTFCLTDLVKKKWFHVILWQ